MKKTINLPEELQGRLEICNNKQIKALRTYSEACEEEKRLKDYSVQISFYGEIEVNVSARNRDEADEIASGMVSGDLVMENVIFEKSQITRKKKNDKMDKGSKIPNRRQGKNYSSI